VLSSSLDATLRLWDAATGALLRTFDAHTDDVTRVAFSPDGTRVLSGSASDDTIRLWDVATGTLLRTFEHKSVASVAFGLAPGEWTDDTSMALALADTLIIKGGLDEHDLMLRFCAWQEMGEYSHSGHCIDIGNTVRAARSRFRRTGNPITGSIDPLSAGNGSLMRLSPIAIRYADDADARANAACCQSRTTHGAAEAVAACEAYADLLAEAICIGDRDRVLQPRTGAWPDKVARAMSMETVGWDRAHVRGSGYVIHSLESSLRAVGNARDYGEAVLLAANLGEDADTPPPSRGSSQVPSGVRRPFRSLGSPSSPGVTAWSAWPTGSLPTVSRGDDRCEVEPSRASKNELSYVGLAQRSSDACRPCSS
jgi:ADP-ribosylglycohydrolase